MVTSRLSQNHSNCLCQKSRGCLRKFQSDLTEKRRETGVGGENKREREKGEAWGEKRQRRGERREAEQEKMREEQRWWPGQS